MHVYTVVELKSNRIGFLKVELRPLDYSTVVALSVHVRIGYPRQDNPPYVFLLAEFVVAADLKRSAGGSITTS